MEAWLRTGRTGRTASATIAAATVDNHKHGSRTLRAAWAEGDPLKTDAETDDLEGTARYWGHTKLDTTHLCQVERPQAPGAPEPLVGRFSHGCDNDR